MAVIKPTLAIKGNLSALVIDGHIEGIIAHHKKHLTVGKQGRVKGLVYANSVTVLGQVIGDIRSDGIVSLAKGADVEGNIFCARALIEDGASFRGKIDMGEPPKVTVSNEPAQAEPVCTEKPRTVAAKTAKAGVY